MSWMVPERKLFGNFYPVFRPNVGVQFGGISIYDHTADVPWECPIYDMQWHLPIEKGLDLRDAQLPNGMYLRAIEPNRVFEFGFRSDELELDLRYEALMQPLMSGASRICFPEADISTNPVTSPVA